MNRTLFLITLILILQNSIAQSIVNVNFEQRGNNIVVRYDFQGALSKNKYDMKLYFIDESGNNVVPINITGDIKNIKNGKMQEIIWDVLADGIELIGNYKAVIEIAKSYEYQGGGASNCLLSMIVPGLGDYFVDYNHHNVIKPWFVTLSVLGAGYLSHYYASKSNDYYNQYQNAVTLSDINDKYNSANQYHHNSFISGSIAGILWITDIIYVAHRGHLNTIKNNKIGVSNFRVLPLNNGLQIGFVKNF